MPQDTAVYSRSFGTGPRKVLALHCSLAHSGAWRGVGGLLADEATLIAFDMPSHGRSPDRNPALNVHDEVSAFAETFLTEPMDVIGHSFGATVALRLAETYPDLVRSVAIIEPVLFAVAEIDNPELAAERDASRSAFKAALANGDRAEATRLFQGDWGQSPEQWNQLDVGQRAKMVRAFDVVLASEEIFHKDTLNMLDPEKLANVVMPTLLLHGDQTDPLVTEVCAGLERRLPGARNICVSGAGHMLPITHPAETVKHLRALWAE